jgi:hypothetical protein
LIGRSTSSTASELLLAGRHEGHGLDLHARANTK